MSRRILEDIFAARRQRVREAESKTPVALLKSRALEAPPTRDFVKALADPGLAFIAEVKKASPSKGVLRSHFDPVALATSYEAGGAAAISVVTEPDFFQGQLEWLREIRKSCACPLLRKDFVFSPYQVWEARVAGADAILLILAMLKDDLVLSLLAEARTAGLACLLEVHNEEEARRAARVHPALVGVNNRDLQTFDVRLETSETLAHLLPAGALRVSESGIFTHDDCVRLVKSGYKAFLVGEALVKDPNPADRLRSLRGFSA